MPPPPFKPALSRTFSARHSSPTHPSPRPQGGLQAGLSIGVGRAFRLPLPPNRTCGFPASGSPVGGSPLQGLTALSSAVNMRFVWIHDFTHPHREWMSPVCIALFSTCAGFEFVFSDDTASTFLRALRSTPITALHRYYGRSDSWPEALCT